MALQSAPEVKAPARVKAEWQGWVGAEGSVGRESSVCRHRGAGADLRWPGGTLPVQRAHFLGGGPAPGELDSAQSREQRATDSQGSGDGTTFAILNQPLLKQSGQTGGGPNGRQANATIPRTWAPASRLE